MTAHEHGHHHEIAEPAGGSCAHCLPTAQAGEPGPARPRWYTQPRLWAVGVVMPLVVVGFVWLPLRSTTEVFGRYVAATWWAIGLGLLLGGVIERFVPKEYIAKFLSAPGPRTVLLATGLGFLFSGCSHGCLALSMELHKKGAAPAAVISFLLASPWASLSLTLVMLSLFGVKGLVIVAAALGVAGVSGLAFLQLARRGLLEPNPHTVAVDPNFSVVRDLTQRLTRYRLTARQVAQDFRAVFRGAWMLADMVVWWLLIGFFLASLLGSLIPHETFTRYFGPTLLGLVATMLVATVIEICSEGSAPIAFELYRHTGALGNSFAFLMGGVVTDVTELGLIWTNLGKRTALWMLALTLPQVFLAGLLLNRW